MGGGDFSFLLGIKFVTNVNCFNLLLMHGCFVEKINFVFSLATQANSLGATSTVTMYNATSTCILYKYF